jgi:hypothetical protein
MQFTYRIWQKTLTDTNSSQYDTKQYNKNLPFQYSFFMTLDNK